MGFNLPFARGRGGCPVFIPTVAGRRASELMTLSEFTQVSLWNVATASAVLVDVVKDNPRQSWTFKVDL